MEYNRRHWPWPKGKQCARCWRVAGTASGAYSKGLSPDCSGKQKPPEVQRPWFESQLCLVGARQQGLLKLRWLLKQLSAEKELDE